MAGSPNAKKRPALDDEGEYFKLLGLLVALPIALLLLASAAVWALTAGSILGELLRVLGIAFGLNVVFFAFLLAAHIRGLQLDPDDPGRLEFDSRYIRRISESGERLADIDTNREFEWRHLEIENGFARYRLYQDGTRLEFASDEPAAPTIVTEILGREWPPRRKIRLHYSG